MLALTWQTYLILAAVVFVSVTLAAFLFDFIDDKRSKRKDPGPFPCMTHMGTAPDGVETWCLQQYGHQGMHTTQWGLDEEEFNEWKESFDDMLATAGLNALADPDPFTQTQETTFEKIDMDKVTDAGGHVSEETGTGSLDLFPLSVGTYGEPDLTVDQCNSRNLGGLGHRCLYPAGHEGAHYTPRLVVDEEPVRCLAEEFNDHGKRCILDEGHSVDHAYEN